MNTKTLLAIFALILYCGVSHAQEKLTWSDLADVSFNAKYFASADDYFLAPTFGKRVLLFHNKLVRITGYFLDLDSNGSILLLSRNPMSSCFFCGGAGPESVIEIKFSEKTKFKTDQIITVTGVLHLNSDDLNQCNYTLKNATAVPAAK